MTAEPIDAVYPTDEDLALVLFIATHAVQHGYPPTYREVATARGLAYSTAKDRVERLVRIGLLAHPTGTRRTLRVVR